ncbi:MAG: hypothetical protein H0V67_11175 [Geodermatophilaceae bacterium]|nr:hypothetical protein [Geodermatophilaceae bacterium]
MPNYLSNRGKLLLMQGDWDDVAAGDIFLGLIVNTSAATPAAFDTQAEINPLNFVADLTALTGFVEASWAGYARTALTRTAASEDDTNNRVNMDAADVVFASAAVVTTYTHCIGGFIFKTGASDAARPLISVALWSAAVALNGSSLTVGIADAYRAS